MKLKLLNVVLLFTILPLSIIEAQIQTGKLRIELNTDSAYVVIGNDYYTAHKIASGDTIELDAGRRIIKLFTPFAKSGTQYLRVFADSTVTYTFNFNQGRITYESLSENIAARYHFNANVIVLTDEDSEIYYKGAYKGTGFAAFNAPEELAHIQIKNPDFGNYKRSLSVRERQVNYVKNYNRPDKFFSRVYSFFPGGSQAYKRQTLKSAALGLSTAGLITFAALRNAKYHNELDVFHEYKTEYVNAETEEKAFRLGDLTERQRDLVAKIDNQRKFLLISGLLVYAYNIYDGFTSKPKGGYANKDKDLEFYLSQQQISGKLNPAGTLRYNF